ncbi:MAG: AmmeMemoRadiSam system protein A [Bdellovibrionota bacterium]
MEFQLTANEQQICLKIVRETLESLLNLGSAASQPVTGTLEEPLPCFVTLTTDEGELRGCIGCLETLSPLHENLRTFAEKAAFEDPRFEPVRPEELASLNIKVAVLGPIQPLRSLDDVELGKHGLCVSFGSKRGVLLASVAIEWGWDRDEFLSQTCKKAGLDPQDASKYSLEYFEEISFSET